MTEASLAKSPPVGNQHHQSQCHQASGQHLAVPPKNNGGERRNNNENGRAAQQLRGDLRILHLSFFRIKEMGRRIVPAFSWNCERHKKTVSVQPADMRQFRAWSSHKASRRMCGRMENVHGLFERNYKQDFLLGISFS